MKDLWGTVEERLRALPNCYESVTPLLLRGTDPVGAGGR
jgi:hypothetical protein